MILYQNWYRIPEKGVSLEAPFDVLKLLFVQLKRMGIR